MSGELMTVHDLAEYLRVPVSWVYRNWKSQGIPHTRLGRHFRFERDAIEAWLKEQRYPREAK